ncbi:amino acid transporter [Kluyveromyces lactis]|uniref:KLLA0E06931p n=1 Tax=Kluyveromyces lactis (strain ATCC 8585 / CBS 2359 / DSM 70799 / NBRC 1267 / NRRL Y-1140 / WM37) TaxID=284590 RepID=Q6CP78_KLULA|nr:uncharacterized protein KLLA0_E06931g [Kluyveromyces lactis]CAG99348.1 KLLA0E06931p [Kluyveromyces lactis]|eukprot:XP_454261.1 uncharacterized protein KLLA0_E06931g [Kluyveromyces lactis]
MSSSVQSGVITLLHTACGAGILAMPYAFKPFGLILGLSMIIFCGLCSSTGLYLQSYVSKYVPPGHASFFTLCRLTRPELSVVFDAAIAVKCFGVGVSYLVVVGDLLPQIMSTFTTHGWLLSRQFHITAVTLIIVTPLCFIKKLDSLRYTSSIAITAVGYLCVLVVFHFAVPNSEIDHLRGHVSIWKPSDVDSSMLSSFPIFVFAYTCHHNMFSIINEQSDKSLDSITKLIRIAITLAMSLYISIGALGYCTFGDHITGNIITLYPNSISSTIGRIAIALLVILAFPLQCHPARASVNHILHYFSKGNTHPPMTTTSAEQNSLLRDSELESSEQLTYECEDELIEENSANQPPVVTLEGPRFIFITSGILLFSYILAMSVTSLANVLSIVGATGSTSISFILPGIFGYKLIASEYAKSVVPPAKERILRIISLLLAIWGFIVMITSLSATIFLHATH